MHLRQENRDSFENKIKPIYQNLKQENANHHNFMDYNKALNRKNNFAALVHTIKQQNEKSLLILYLFDFCLFFLSMCVRACVFFFYFFFGLR